MPWSPSSCDEPRLRHPGAARLRPEAHVDHALHARGLAAPRRARAAAAARSRSSTPWARGEAASRARALAALRRPRAASVGRLCAARSPSSCCSPPLLAAVVAAPTGAQDEGSLRDQIGAAKARERTLVRGGRPARQARAPRPRAQVAILEGRVTDRPDRADARRGPAGGHADATSPPRAGAWPGCASRLAQVRAQLAVAAARALHGRRARLHDRRAATATASRSCWRR